MIDINKKYRTVDGKEVRIYTVDGGGKYPIHGAILKNKGWWSVVSWTKEGKYIQKCTNSYDLVEVKPKVAYLKPMFVILSECDSYSFENTGVVLRRDYGVNFIGFNELSLFGKETSTPEKYPDWFIEWREEDD